MPDQTIQLGSTVKDTITGFSGIAVGRSTWLYGCVRIIVQTQELKDGKPIEPQWFDESQLEIMAPPSEAILKTLAKDAPPQGPRPDPSPAKCPTR